MSLFGPLAIVLPVIVGCTPCADGSRPDSQCICEDGKAAKMDQCFPESLNVAWTPVDTVPDGPWSGWGVNYGLITAQDDPSAIVHEAPGEGQTSYLIAPAEVARAIRLASAIKFKRKIESAWEGAGYDIIVRSNEGVAYASLPGPVGTDWQSFDLSLSDAEFWHTTQSDLATVLKGASSLFIRAEFTSGADRVLLSDFEIAD